MRPNFSPGQVLLHLPLLMHILLLIVLNDICTIRGDKKNSGQAVLLIPLLVHRRPPAPDRTWSTIGASTHQGMYNNRHKKFSKMNQRLNIWLFLHFWKHLFCWPSQVHTIHTTLDVIRNFLEIKSVFNIWSFLPLLPHCLYE